MDARKHPETPAGNDWHDEDEVLEGYIVTDKHWSLPPGMGIESLEDIPEDKDILPAGTTSGASLNSRLDEIQATAQEVLIESVSGIEKVQADEAEQTSKKLETMSANIHRLNSLLRR